MRPKPVSGLGEEPGWTVKSVMMRLRPTGCVVVTMEFHSLIFLIT